MSNYTEIISALLDCGSADVSFIDSELDKFNVGAHEVVENMRGGDEEFHVNTFIHHLYLIALTSAGGEVGIVEFDDDEVSIFTNCIDSHLFVKDKDGQSVEIHDYDELVEFLKSNYANTDSDE